MIPPGREKEREREREVFLIGGINIKGGGGGILESKRCFLIESGSKGRSFHR